MHGKIVLTIAGRNDKIFSLTQLFLLYHQEVRTKRRTSVDTTVAAFGLACWEGRPLLMECSHRHHELELNYLSSGTIIYSFGGVQTRVTSGELALFWAAMPHQIVALDEPAHIWWVTLPLALFVHWQLPATLVNPVLHGQPIVVPGTEPEVELARLRQWQIDLTTLQEEQQMIVILELEAL